MRRTWAPRGQTPVIASAGSWRTRSVIGIITCTPKGRRPRLFLRLFGHTVKRPDVVRCLKEFRRHIKGRIILVWDGLSPHRAKETREFVRAQRRWLRVYRFPAYAPELNPPEYLFSALKSKCLAGLYAGDINALDARIKSGKRRFQRRPDLLTGFLKRSTLFEKELSI